MTAPRQPLAKGALALIILLGALFGAAYTSATPRLPPTRSAHALAHVTPGRAWSPLRPLSPPARGDANLNAAMRRWLPGADASDARTFMAEFEARGLSLFDGAPAGSGRSLRDLLDRLYRQAGRYPTLIATWAQAHDHCQRMRALGPILGATAAAALSDLTRHCVHVAPWLAHGLSELGDPVAALDLIREAVRRDPSHTEALFFYALILLQQPTQDPLALLTFRNLIDDILRREPNFVLLDITAAQLRDERAEADRLLRALPPPPPPRRVASDTLHAAFTEALTHARLYISPPQHLAFIARSTTWWLSRLLSPPWRALTSIAPTPNAPADDTQP